MFTKIHRAILVPFMLLTAFAAQTQDKTAKTKRATLVSRESCDAEKGQAYTEGWTKSFEFTDAVQSLSVGDNSGSGKFGLRLLVEDFTGGDSFQYAAAEVVRTHFSQNIVVDPQSNLMFWIHGTKALQVASGYDVQTIGMDIYIMSGQKLVRGNSKNVLTGRFTIGSVEQVVAGYSSEQKTQVVREMAYKVLSEFLSDWQRTAK